MININYAQAQKIVDAFGGDESTIVTLEVGKAGHSGPGIYLGFKDHAEEGGIYLGEEE